MNEQRFEELLTAMKAFKKKTYEKKELLPEMFTLQQEIVELTFNGAHASTADLRIWDVVQHLDQLNQDCGNVADDELRKFKEESKVFSNLIRAEISGNRGEAKAFRTLKYLHSKNIVLKNVEFTDGDCRTELDAVVITPEVITIIEVKNTAKDVFIDERGDYYRTGEFLRRDSNIAEKMTLKEGMLRKVLLDAGFTSFDLRSVVVFTDNRIEVQNNYPEIRTSFVSQLNHIIDSYKGTCNLSEEDMTNIENAIENAACKESYPFEFDVAQYKMDFAKLMATLEEASARKEEKDQKVEGEENVKVNKKVITEKGTDGDIAKNFFASQYTGYVASSVLAATVTALSIMAVKLIKKGALK